MALTSPAQSPATGTVPTSPRTPARVLQYVRKPRVIEIHPKHLVAFFGSYAVLVVAFVALAASCLAVR